jgi:hypothetical protein
MAKPNYNYEKRAREIEKQKKKEEKRKKKQAIKESKQEEATQTSQTPDNESSQ